VRCRIIAGVAAHSRPHVASTPARPRPSTPGNSASLACVDAPVAATSDESADPDAAQALCRAIGAVVLSRIEIEHYLDRLHELYPSRLPSLEKIRADSARDRGARLLKRVSRQERNRACVRDLEFWLAACLRFAETAAPLVAPHALLAPDAARLERAASDGRWAAANLKRLCHWLEREQVARRRTGGTAPA
jgi:hypothetical protein